MNMKEECRKQVFLVKESVGDPTAAYVARTRLKRLLLACSRMIAREYGLEEPVLPGPLHVPEGASPQFNELALRCNRLVGAAETLCQPSEPLDDRWRSEWATVSAELEHINRILTSVAPNNARRSTFGTFQPPVN